MAVKSSARDLLTSYLHHIHSVTPKLYQPQRIVTLMYWNWYDPDAACPMNKLLLLWWLYVSPVNRALKPNRFLILIRECLIYYGNVLLVWLPKNNRCAEKSACRGRFRPAGLTSTLCPRRYNKTMPTLFLTEKLLNVYD